MDDLLRQTAAELGFEQEPCHACGPETQAGCPNCEGLGLVWRHGAASLSRSGMVRLTQRVRSENRSRGG